MTVDRIKISQEINFNGMPTWIGLEGSLIPGEDEKEALRTLQKSITDYQTEEAQKYKYTQHKWKVNQQPEYGPVKSLIEEMDACTVLDKDAGGLLSFELTIKNPEEKLFYDFKLNQLTNKK